MSAFIVSDAVMQKVVRAISVSRNSSWSQPFAGISVKSANDLDRIGAALFDMNDEAVSQRYGDEPQHAGEGWKFNNNFAPMSTNEKVAASKAMQCLIYQCSEGDVMDNGLFAALKAEAAYLAEDIIASLPAYADAAWGE